ncbi:hypothetical protein Pelo_9257 [Pelomyxa schiedti]|nr:hypothetical protein Pelo_9257 [Pelomyxa schiedti]
MDAMPATPLSPPTIPSTARRPHVPITTRRRRPSIPHSPIVPTTPAPRRPHLAHRRRLREQQPSHLPSAPIIQPRQPLLASDTDVDSDIPSPIFSDSTPTEASSITTETTSTPPNTEFQQSLLPMVNSLTSSTNMEDSSTCDFYTNSHTSNGANGHPVMENTGMKCSHKAEVMEVTAKKPVTGTPPERGLSTSCEESTTVNREVLLARPRMNWDNLQMFRRTLGVPAGCMSNSDLKQLIKSDRTSMFPLFSISKSFEEMRKQTPRSYGAIEGTSISVVAHSGYAVCLKKQTFSEFDKISLPLQAVLPLLAENSEFHVQNVILWGLDFVMTQYIPGFSLREYVYLNQHYLSTIEILHLAKDIVHFVVFLTSSGIIPTDLKSENVVIHKGTLYYIDVSAYLEGEQQGNFTLTYFPDELFKVPSRKLRKWSIECTTFSLGAIIGELMFDDTLAEFASRTLSERDTERQHTQTLTPLNTGTDPKLFELWSQMTEAEPFARPQLKTCLSTLEGLINKTKVV